MDLNPNLNPETTASVIEDRRVELARALAVGDHVDFHDLPARDRETEAAFESTTHTVMLHGGVPG